MKERMCMTSHGQDSYLSTDLDDDNGDEGVAVYYNFSREYCAVRT